MVLLSGHLIFDLLKLYFIGKFLRMLGNDLAQYI